MTTERKWKILNLLWPVVVLAVLANVTYTVLTGETFGTNTHYNIVGRIFSGLLGVAFIGFCIWSYRTNRRLDKQLSEAKERREESR